MDATITSGSFKGNLKRRYVINTYNVLEFDGLSDVKLDSVPVVTGTKTIKLKLYITKETGYFGGATGECLVWFGTPASSDYFMITLYENTLRAYVTNLNNVSNKRIPLAGLKNQLLEVEVSKNASIVTDIKINGVSQSLTNVTALGIGAFNYRWIGQGSIVNLSDAYVFDIRLESSGVETNRWLGYPAGNTDPAWVDQTGTNDGTVEGGPIAYDLVVGSDTWEDVPDPHLEANIASNTFQATLD